MRRSRTLAAALAAIALAACGRHPPPVAGVTEMTYAAIPQMRDRFVGTLRARAAAIPDSPTVEVLGTHASAGGAVVHRVAYRVEGQRVTGLLGLPAGEALGGVVLCHPYDDPYRTGLHTEDHVAALAREGYVALAPDYRGWGGSEGQKGGEVIDVVQAVRALRAHPRVGGRKVGLVGFSFGGGIAVKAAEIEPVDSLVAYYPQLGGTWEEFLLHLEHGEEAVSGAVKALVAEARSTGANEKEIRYVFRQTSPLFHVRHIAGPVRLFHSRDDNVVAARQSHALAAALREAGKEVELTELEGLGHAFANSVSNPTWPDLLAFLKRTLS